MMFTVTECARDDIVRHLHIPLERLNVIYPGVRSIFRVSRDLAAFERVRQRYGLPEKFILFVGTLEPRKNLRRLLQALRVLRIERGFEPSLAIVGRKGWLFDSIFSELMDGSLEKSVIVTGYVPDSDLVVLYNMARLLVFPSLYEGFGLPCIEAMACGCPLVTSNRGALREVGGDCAVYADPEDVNAIAQAVWEASENQPLRKHLIDRGLRRVGAFSWDRHAEQLLGTLERVMFGGNGSHT
jgi:glycosyltransferase involved in cell wall biosynthesis